ncbi:hypothetical protein [Saccharothrix syringae]|uniref:hypothetical protein n=1 Tax=Saccharothrix syringae TaxID=103733 RepID=UPI000B18AB99|nr:hypothetical protein [Saccharothrix syringae]
MNHPGADHFGADHPGADHFGAVRHRYVHQPDGGGVFCVGNAAECDHLAADTACPASGP